MADEVIEGGSRVEDAAFYAAELARAGIDFVSVSKGGKFEDAKQPRVGEAAYPYTGPSGLECMPTVFVDAEAALSRGDCDVVGAARQSLAEPWSPNE